ncbi:unnamed protein product [Candidula unifasciata]|uniref:Uncharacterized protein n=1 Tax=Candidula unifasciata TaxID=100452 RepID=A0A8S3ZJ90_9EUPU|nr:unnamed protein product [Candidula unifasciata]
MSTTDTPSPSPEFQSGQDQVCIPVMSVPLLLLAASTVILTVILISWFYRSLRINKKNSDLHVLITGCDTGFGNRCARRLDQLGFHVFAACLTAEKVQELTESCSENLLALQMDVTDEASILEALKTVKKHLPQDKGLWAVINNAGIMGAPVVCEWLNKSDYQATIGVNFLGMMSVTNAFLPLVRKERGRIVNMGSTAGRLAILPASYSVSKFCVEAYSDCLRREVSVMGVSVHIIEPGGYQTNITNADLHVSSISKRFSELDSEVQTFYGETYKKKLMDTISLSCKILSTSNIDEVVDAYIHAVTARFPKIRYVVGLNGNLVFRPLWTLPTWLVDFAITLAVPKPEGLKSAS